MRMGNLGVGTSTSPSDAAGSDEFKDRIARPEEHAEVLGLLVGQKALLVKKFHGGAQEVGSLDFEL